MVDAYHLMRRAVPLKQLLLQSDAVIATVLQDNKAGMISLVLCAVFEFIHCIFASVLFPDTYSVRSSSRKLISCLYCQNNQLFLYCNISHHSVWIEGHHLILMSLHTNW
jgi:hypothetical protein